MARICCWGAGLTLQPEDVLAQRSQRPEETEPSPEEANRRYHNAYMREYNRRKKAQETGQQLQLLVEANEIMRRRRRAT